MPGRARPWYENLPPSPILLTRKSFSAWKGFFSRISSRSSRLRGYAGLRFHREGAKDAKKTRSRGLESRL